MLAPNLRTLTRIFPATRGTVAPSRAASARLSLISRHLDQRLPLPALNTPFSTERISVDPDDIEYKPLQRSRLGQKRNLSTSNSPPKMSSQAAHNTLLIPGPIEFDDAVLQSMSHYAYVAAHYPHLISPPTSYVMSNAVD